MKGSAIVAGLARREGQSERAEHRAEPGAERGRGHAGDVDLAGAREAQRRGARTEGRGELVGRHHRDRIEPGEGESGNREQAAAAGDRVDEAGEEADRVRIARVAGLIAARLRARRVGARACETAWRRP